MLGLIEGEKDGLKLGDRDGEIDWLGLWDGLMLGLIEGEKEDTSLGEIDGDMLGERDGDIDCEILGDSDGLKLGLKLGLILWLGDCDGEALDDNEGDTDGLKDPTFGIVNNSDDIWTSIIVPEPVTVFICAVTEKLRFW